MRIFLLALFCIFINPAVAQKIHLGLNGGLANYNGDLLDKLYVGKQNNGFIGFTVHYEITDQLLVRAGYNFARVNGDDMYSSDPQLQKRNLSFETALSEFNTIGEFYLFNLYEKRFSPYLFAGLAMFHFNPYTYDTTGQKIFLNPLSTEGQGIYGNNKTYKLTQVAIPMGGGLKFAVNENIRFGFEIGLRKLFTDYLDDVSTNYADYNDLLNAKGPVAVELAFREDELPGSSAVYPAKDTQRGNPAQKDVYFFTGLNLSFRLGGKSAGTSSYRYSGKKSNLGCPANPL